MGASRAEAELRAPYKVDDSQCAEDLEHHVGRRHARLHAQVPLLRAKVAAAAAFQAALVRPIVRLRRLEQHRVAAVVCGRGRRRRLLVERLRRCAREKGRRGGGRIAAAR
jgi:hypothetical protein